MTALVAMALDCATCRSISLTDADNSSAAEAMSRTLAEASDDDFSARAVLARGIVGSGSELRRCSEHLIRNSSEFGKRRFYFGRKMRNLIRHLLLALRPQIGIVEHGTIEFFVATHRILDMPIERASASTARSTAASISRYAAEPACWHRRFARGRRRNGDIAQRGRADCRHHEDYRGRRRWRFRRRHPVQ